jgi:hypothetical protein
MGWIKKIGVDIKEKGLKEGNLKKKILLLRVIAVFPLR